MNRSIAANIVCESVRKTYIYDYFLIVFVLSLLYNVFDKYAYFMILYWAMQKYYGTKEYSNRSFCALYFKRF